MHLPTSLILTTQIDCRVSQSKKIGKMPDLDKNEAIYMPFNILYTTLLPCALRKRGAARS
jgi:hypothetical protein